MRINAPKGTLSVALRQQIVQHKEEILCHLRRGAVVPNGVLPPIQRVPTDQPLPLSFAQERLWFLEQFEPGSSIYNLCRGVRISGALDLRALESSLNEIFRRHEALRTKFLAVDGRPFQVVAPAQPFSVTPIDLRRLSETERKNKTAHLLAAQAREPFDLTRGALLRIRLVRTRDDEHVLGFFTHHIAADAWSMGIFTRELWTLYQNLATGTPRRLPELPVQYRDYAVWQRGWLQGNLLDAQLAYWKKQLEVMTVLDLPTDRPRSRRQTFRGARVRISLSPSLTAALNVLSKREGVTLFMTLLAALQILLHRYSGQEDIVVGSPVANRHRKEIEGMIGFFVNTLVLRTDLSGEPSFRELLERVREVCLDAYAHQEIPFEKLVEELRPQRDAERNPLFQVMLVLQNTPSQTASPLGVTLAAMEIDNPAAQFDLSLYLREREGRLIGFFEYAADLFDAATIERMAGHFQKILEGIVANPERPIAMLAILTDAEMHRLLVEWNDTAAEFPENATMHQLFEAQVERTPDRAAVELAGERVTYRELNQRANHLAHYLRQMGIGPEKFVGVLTERSVDMVVSLLAILKAGGAYVPLDPAYPKARLQFMLSDSNAGLLLTQRRFAAEIVDYQGTVVFVDQLPAREYCGGKNPVSGATADSAMYVIYTSGSTGAPKGVLGLHRGALNRFSWMWETYPFSPGEKSCHKTSLSFVDSVWEIFGALLQGVPTVIIPDALAKEPRLLLGELAARKVTRFVLVPSLLSEILDASPELGEKLVCLKYYISSGETLSTELAARFKKTLPGCRLINLYGSSEVSADVTCYEIRDEEHDPAVLIGRPIHNTQIYLLDSHLQPVPLGVSAELYVGGENLARGYLNRPELTAEKFVPSPFHSDAASRLYRTGDLARYRPDGNIECLGRLDSQVKIRGCRVELGEIETALCQHPAVRECLVALRGEVESETGNPKSAIQNPKSGKFLVAYVVLREGRASAGELRAFLKEKLPDFMVPSSFVVLDRLPLMPNGKIDRRALPPPENERVNANDIIIGPSGEIEALVAQVWQQILQVERVAVDDNFFDLGGHSLLAAQVVGKLSATFSTSVSLRDLFEAPTVRDLAGLVGKTLQADRSAKLPPIVPVLRKRAMPLSLSQEQLFLFSQLFGGGDFLNMPYAYRLVGPLDVPALQRAIGEIVRRHGALRTGFTEGPNGPVQAVRRRVKFKLLVVDLSSRPAENRQAELEQLSKRDAHRAFDLEKPPLIRAKLLHMAEAEHVLLVTLHHIVTDQWSMGVFRKEFAALYDAFSRALPSPLAELPVQFSDFACWQRGLLTSKHLADDISYWHEQLGDPSPTLDFQRGRKRRRTVRFHSSRRPFLLDAAQFADIKSFARAESCTPFMVFITALNVLLYRYTGQNDIRIGTLVANRGQRGTEALIGYFVNAVVLRTRLSPTFSWRQLLKEVRQICLTAYAHQDVPFEYLEASLEKRSRGAPSMYQVMLNYRSLSSPTLPANGLTIASWNEKNRAADPGIAISRLDVNFHLREVSTKLTGAVNYRSDLFDEGAITGLLEAYLEILKQMIAQPEQEISRVATESTLEARKS